MFPKDPFQLWTSIAETTLFHDPTIMLSSTTSFHEPRVLSITIFSQETYQSMLSNMNSNNHGVKWNLSQLRPPT